MKKLIAFLSLAVAMIAAPTQPNPVFSGTVLQTGPLSAFNAAAGITPFTELEVDSTATTSPRGVMSAQWSATNDGARFHMRKGRGTRASPTVITTGDNLGRLVASGYDGSNYIETASILLGSTGTIASTRVPSYIEFYTGTNAAPTVMTAAAKFDTDQGLKFPNTNTPGIQLYNTVDQVTNYERLEAVWTGNVATIRSTAGGTGTIRSLSIGNVNGFLLVNNDLSSGRFQFSAGSTANPSAKGITFTLTSTATSGTIIGALSLTPTYNQASGTAANTDLLIARTSTATGSGAQNLILASDDGATKFSVSDTGNELLAGTAHRWSGYGAGALTTDGSGNITAVSDGRLKDIDGDYTTGLSSILKITPKVFHWKASSGLDTSDVNVGLIAQDLLAAGLEGAVGTTRSVDLMETVKEDREETDDLGNKRIVSYEVLRQKAGPDGRPMKTRVAADYYTVSDRAIIATLINAIKELSAKNDTLEARLTKLEKN